MGWPQRLLPSRIDCTECFRSAKPALGSSDIERCSCIPAAIGGGLAVAPDSAQLCRMTVNLLHFSPLVDQAPSQASGIVCQSATRTLQFTNRLGVYSGLPARQDNQVDVMLKCSFANCVAVYCLGSVPAANISP